MIRYTIGGQRYEVRARRAVGFVLTVVLACAAFDIIYTTALWAALPFGIGFGLYLDWLMPTFRFWGHVRDLRRLHRGLRKLRGDRMNCGQPRFELEAEAVVARLGLLLRAGAGAARWAVVECTYCGGWHVAPVRRWWR